MIPIQIIPMLQLPAERLFWKCLRCGIETPDEKYPDWARETT